MAGALARPSLSRRRRVQCAAKETVRDGVTAELQFPGRCDCGCAPTKTSRVDAINRTCGSRSSLWRKSSVARARLSGQVPAQPRS